jgi:hypothetical protein
MKRNETVEVRITEERKQRWNEYVEESTEVANLSDLIRLACEQKITGAIDREAVDLPEVTVGEEMESGINQLDAKLDEVVRSLAELESEINNTESHEQLVDDLRALLVEVPDRETFRELDAHASIHPRATNRIAGTPKALADIIGIDHTEAQKLLTRAERRYPDVQYITGKDGGIRYYRLNPDIEQVRSGQIDPKKDDGFRSVTELSNDNESPSE